MTGPSETDAELVAALRAMWHEQDPVPADLSERVLVAVGMDDLELELLLLSQTAELTGARSAQTARTLTFSGDAVSVMVTISPSRRHRFRLDGWVAPLANGRVEARHSSGQDVEAPVDGDGRFVLHDVPAGLVQLVYHPGGSTDGDAHGAATAASARSVAAPPIQL